MKKIILIVILFTIFLLSLVAGGRTIEKSPAFCASCHEMESSYKRWVSSGAADKHEDCIQCHSGPGLIGVVGAEMRGLRQVYKHITGDFNDIEKLTDLVPDNFCLKCHDNQEMVNEHNEHNIDRSGKRCALCHNHKGDNKFFTEID